MESTIYIFFDDTKNGGGNKKKLEPVHFASKEKVKEKEDCENSNPRLNFRGKDLPSTPFFVFPQSCIHS